MDPLWSDDFLSESIKDGTREQWWKGEGASCKNSGDPPRRNDGKSMSGSSKGEQDHSVAGPWGYVLTPWLLGTKDWPNAKPKISVNFNCYEHNCWL